jgi:hypothetical protein
MAFTPLINYQGYAHVLNAVPCFVHPVNGNLYGIAIEKQGGTRQNLSVYRVRAGSTTRELVKRYIGGGIDAQAQIAAGGCVIHQDGSLEVWASAAPVGVPPISETGFVGGFWPRIPNVDAPWSSGGVTLFALPRTSPMWEGRQILPGAGELVDIPAVFGVSGASAYLLRFVATAAAADVRVRAGTEYAPHFLTVNTQVANIQVHTQGWTPGPLVYVSAVNGAATVWLQVCGYA